MQTRFGRVARRQQPGADVAAGGDPRGRDEQQQTGRSRQQQHERTRAGERPQFLRPPQWRRPAQPAGAIRGVGDDSQQQK